MSLYYRIAGKFHGRKCCNFVQNQTFCGFNFMIRSILQFLYRILLTSCSENFTNLVKSQKSQTLNLAKFSCYTVFPLLRYVYIIEISDTLVIVKSLYCMHIYTINSNILTGQVQLSQVSSHQTPTPQLSLHDH